MQPRVNLNELDGAMGVLPQGDRPLAVVGPAEKGPANLPAAYNRSAALPANFGAGPGPEAAAHFVDRYRRPVIFVRVETSNPGDYGALDTDGVSGDRVVTTSSGSEPLDDYEVVVQILTGGTVGTAGITYRWSLDGGRTWSPETALGTATTVELDGSGVSFDLDTGDLEDGDTWSVVTTAPAWDTTDIATALDALFASTLSWELCEIVGPIDAAGLAAIDAKFVGAAADGKYRAWIGNTRMQEPGESAAEYRTSLDGNLGSVSTLHGELCAGDGEMVSAISGRQFRRPASFVIAARQASVEEHVNIADVNLGPLPIQIRDGFGNPLYHDESVNPGLDDSRFTVLRTWEGFEGVYVNRPLLFSPTGSDFDLLAHRRVMNLAQSVLRPYFVRRLNRDILIDRKTGFILEAEAIEIENGARKAMSAALMTAPKANAVGFTLSRTDNLLSTKTLTGQASITPLAYPETINVDIGFKNPALQVQRV